MNQPASRYRYVIAAACFAIQAIGIGYYVSYGVFFHPLNAEFGWSRTAISGASSLAFILMGLFGILVGRLNDRIGPRIIMTISGCIFGLGHLLMSGITAVWQLYLFYGVCVGIGLSAIDVIPLSTTARWFIRNRGTMTGIVKVGTGAGQFAVPLIASFLITSYGWRNSYMIMGAAVLMLLVFIGQFLRRDPGQMDLSKDNENKIPKGKLYSTLKDLSLGEALRTRQFWTICIANLAAVFCLLSIMVHIVPHAQDLGASASKAAGVLATIGGVSMFGRFACGIAVDRIGCRVIMMISFILLISGLLWLQVARDLWMLYLFAVIYGISHGGIFTSISPMVAEYFGITSHGVLFGIVAFSGTLGGSIGPFLTGYIFDITSGYGAAFWLFAFTSLLGLVMIISLKPVGSK
ncbi:MAG: MFS transporter [Thermodesulfobacteriota bacterium]